MLTRLSHVYMKATVAYYSSWRITITASASRRWAENTHTPAAVSHFFSPSVRYTSVYIQRASRLNRVDLPLCGCINVIRLPSVLPPFTYRRCGRNVVRHCQINISAGKIASWKLHMQMITSSNSTRKLHPVHAWHCFFLFFFWPLLFANTNVRGPVGITFFVAVLNYLFLFVTPLP